MGEGGRGRWDGDVRAAQGCHGMGDGGERVLLGGYILCFIDYVLSLFSSDVNQRLWLRMLSPFSTGTEVAKVQEDTGPLSAVYTQNNKSAIQANASIYFEEAFPDRSHWSPWAVSYSLFPDTYITLGKAEG